MIPETWVIPLLFFFTVIWIMFLLSRNQNHQPPLPPGPKALPIVGNLFSLDSELHTCLASLAKGYGSMYSLQLGTKLCVVISSRSQAKEVLKVHDIIFANHDVPIAGKVGTYGGVNIVWSPYGSLWRLLRKVCVKGMLGAAPLEAVYSLRRHEIRQIIRRFSDKTENTPVNVGEEVFLAMLRVVTGMLWGKTEVTAEERESIGLEFRAAVKEFVTCLSIPNLSDFFPALAWFDMQGVEKRMRRCVKWLDGIFEKVIDQRLRINGKGQEGRREEKDFLQVLLQMKEGYEDSEASDNESFSMTHIKALLIDMVMGGTDTTSNTVEFAMAEIMNKPEVLEKVQQELDTVVGSESIVEENQIHKLPYLQAVVKETLRLHPVGPLLVPHCPTESCVVGGYTIPKGSQVIINVWAIHRDPLIWSDPLNFKPERFLNAKFDFYGNDFSYLPFGSGRRICPGIAMAEKLTLFSLASLLHSFDWKLPEGEHLNLQEKFGIVLSKRTPLILIPKCRLSNPALYE